MAHRSRSLETIGSRRIMTTHAKGIDGKPLCGKMARGSWASPRYHEVTCRRCLHHITTTSK